MPVDKFIVWTAVGAAFWTFALMLAGYFLSRHLSVISQVMDKLSVVVVVLLLAAVCYHVWRSIRKKR